MMSLVRVAAAIAFLLLASVAVPAGTAKSAALFFETVIVEDTDGDYAAAGATSGGFDFVALYVTEKRIYDPEKKEDLGDFVVFRFEPASLTAPCQSTIRLEVSFKVDGNAKKGYVDLNGGAPSPSGGSCVTTVAGGSGIASRFGNTAQLSMKSTDLGVVPGSQLTGFWARSALVSGENMATQDVAPYDNMNAPGGDNPAPANPKTYTAVGVYPFLMIHPITPLEQYSVGGAEVSYDFHVMSDPALSDDPIRVLFEFPEGWSISPSLGTTGAVPVGQFSGGSGGAGRMFSFTLSSTGITNEGDRIEVVMTGYTDSGGYARVPTYTTISGPKIVDPNLTISLATPGPFKAGDASTIRFQADYVNGTGDLEGAKFSVDVFQGTKRVATVEAKSLGNGTFEAVYTFPGEGDYRLDVFVANLKPSPHQEFPVSVKGGGLAPAPNLLLALVAALVGGMALVRRRN